MGPHQETALPAPLLLPLLAPAPPPQRPAAPLHHHPLLQPFIHRHKPHILQIPPAPAHPQKTALGFALLQLFPATFNLIRQQHQYIFDYPQPTTTKSTR